MTVGVELGQALSRLYRGVGGLTHHNLDRIIYCIYIWVITKLEDTPNDLTLYVCVLQEVVVKTLALTVRVTELGEETSSTCVHVANQSTLREVSTRLQDKGVVLPAGKTTLKVGNITKLHSLWDIYRDRPI